MTQQDVLLGILWFATFVISVTLHEAAHAFVALKLGDRTAYLGGQVTLDPRPHIRREPFGMVLVPILSLVFLGLPMGWASAPYDPSWADQYPRRAAIMAAAGPISNLLIAIVAGVGLYVGFSSGHFVLTEKELLFRLVCATGNEEGLSRGLGMVLSTFFGLNLLLFVFNLIPVPPLDGAAILPLALSRRAAHRYQEFMRDPLFSILGILIAWQLVHEIFWPVYFFAVDLAYP